MQISIFVSTILSWLRLNSSECTGCNGSPTSSLIPLGSRSWEPNIPTDPTGIQMSGAQHPHSSHWAADVRSPASLHIPLGSRHWEPSIYPHPIGLQVLGAQLLHWDPGAMRARSRLPWAAPGIPAAVTHTLSHCYTFFHPLSLTHTHTHSISLSFIHINPKLFQIKKLKLKTVLHCLICIQIGTQSCICISHYKTLSFWEFPSQKSLIFSQETHEKGWYFPGFV